MRLRPNHRGSFRVNEFLINPLQGSTDPVSEVRVFEPRQ